MRREGAGRARRARRDTLSVLELPKRGGGEWRCSGVSLVEPAGAHDVRRGRRIDRPPLSSDRILALRPLRNAGELKRDAGGAVGRVVRVVPVCAAALDVSGRAPRCPCFGRRRQKRGHTLGRQHEEGGQDENTRTWAAEFLEHAVHYGKLVRDAPAVTTRDRRRAGLPPVTREPRGAFAVAGRGRRAIRRMGD